MKTPHFWYAKPSGITALWPVMLMPFSLVFKGATYLRHLIARPYLPQIPVICVGNIVAGGAGKTPTCLSLAALLRKQGHRPVFVTRGYGGQITKHVVVCVNEVKHTVSDVGDEALMLASLAPTWAGTDRIEAIRLAENHGTIIIMDDGLQNPNIKPTLSILVVDGDVGLGNGLIIPAGPLRETFTDVQRRIKAIIIIGKDDTQNIAANTQIPVFRAHLQPVMPIGFPREGKFVAFAGIGRPEKFYATARAAGLDVVDSCDFPDHHLFDQNDIDALRLRAEENGARLLTTEKDAVRLPSDFRAEVIVLPVELAWDGEQTENRILDIVHFKKA